MLSLQLLGGAVLAGPEGPVTGPASHRHRLGLLALLALSHPRPLGRDKAMALLWPESDGEHARNLLNLSVHVLRKAAGEDAITSTGDGLLINPERIATDLHEFEQAAAAGDHETAVARYGGPLLDGFFIAGAGDFERLVQRERERVARTFQASVERLAEARARAGDLRGAADLWLRLSWSDPFNSRTALRLVQSLDAAGDRAGALHHARQHTQLLADEFGAHPDQEFVAFAATLRHARAPAEPVAIARPAPPGQPRISRPDIHPEGYNLYLKGRYAWSRRTREGLTRSLEYLRQAVELSPTHARAWAALADAWAIAGFYDYLPPAEAFPAAREAARRAAELDPLLVEPAVVLAYVLLYFDWDLDRAERGFREAIERNPSSAVAHQWYGNLLTAAGRFEEAAEQMREAIRLDPLSLIASAALGWVHYHARDYEACIQASRETLELDGTFALAWVRIGLAQERSGQLELARTALERAAELVPGEATTLAALAWVRARSGNIEAARALLAQITGGPHNVPPFEVARIHLALGDREEAFTWLERAKEERSHALVLAAVDPQLDELRDEPRFQVLLAGVHPGGIPRSVPRRAESRRPARRVRTGPLLSGVIALMVLILAAGWMLSRENAAGPADRPAHVAPDPETDNLYQRGRYAWNRRTREGLEQAVTYYQQALARSPGFAPAHAGLAEAYAVLGFYDYRRPAQAFESARQSAREALRLDPTLGEPNATLGYVHLYYDWDLAAGEREFLESLRKRPGYAVAHQWYGNLLTAAGRFDEAVRHMHQAQILDPQSVIASAALGWVYYYARKPDSAITQFYRTLELDRNFSLAHQWLGLTYLEGRQWPEAIRSLDQALVLSPGSLQTASALAYGLARSGQPDSSRAVLGRILARDEYLPSFEIGKVYLALGDTTQALAWLERALQQRSHSIVFLPVDPQLDPLRRHPGFARLLDAAGLAR